MLRDPLYRQIRRRLRELKDGNTFELCANDLLSKFYPSLTPREGGGDAGLDGLIANEDKSSIQLICTTGADVHGNLSGSIESNLKKGGNSHSCILATSQRLTNPKKRSLEERAKQLGRPLIQIHDQAAMAQLLYRDARWLKELSVVGFNQMFVWFLACKVALLIKEPNFDGRFGQRFNIPPKSFNVSKSLNFCSHHVCWRSCW